MVSLLRRGVKNKRALLFSRTLLVTPIVQFSNQLIEKFKKLYDLQCVIPVKLIKAQPLQSKMKVA